MVRKCVKYLILFFVIVLCRETHFKLCISLEESLIQHHYIEQSNDLAFISEIDSDFCLASHVSNGCPLRIKSNTKRTDNTVRYYSQLVKTKSIFNSTIEVYAQIQTMKMKSTLNESSSSLALLGKLII